MKRLVFRWLMGFFAMTLVACAAVVSFAAPDGDFTGKGTSDISDALRCLRIVVGLIQVTALDIAHGDVAPLDPTTHQPKGDGKVDIADALGILRHVVNLDTWSTTNTLPVTGKITFNGSPLQGVIVTLNLTGSGSTSTITTDSNGNYSFTEANGSYTITPSHTGYLFTPANLSILVNGAAVSGQNFTAASSSNVAANVYFPATVGSTWTYSAVDGTTSEQYTSKTVSNINNVITQEELYSSAKRVHNIVVGNSIVMPSMSYNDLLGNTLETLTFSPTWSVFPSSTQVGATETQTVNTTSSIGRILTAKTITITVSGVESVTVPAGSFTSALKILRSIAPPNNNSDTYWYVQNVGMVKHVNNNGGVVEQLITYNIN